MKLYATVTSERASKGQGGKYLDIVIKDAYKDVIGHIKVRVRDHEVGDLYCIDMDFADHVYVKQKGKKQKGEVCPECGSAINQYYMSCTNVNCDYTA